MNEQRKSIFPANQILVTGCHRSGSTFVGRMLGLSERTTYLQEPFNNESGLVGIDEWFLYVSKAGMSDRRYGAVIRGLFDGSALYKRKPLSRESTFFMNVGKFLFRSRGQIDYLRIRLLGRVYRNLIIKDPIACLSSKYLKEMYNVKTLMLIRHPAAYCASAKRLGFDSPLKSLLAQPELVEDYLGEVVADLNVDALTEIESHALTWKCLYAVMTSFVNDGVYDAVVRHEDLSLDPIVHFERLYAELGLNWTERVRAQVESYTGGQNPTDPSGNKAHVLKRNSRDNVKRWKQVLSISEIETIRNMTSDVSDQYYTDQDW